MSLSSLRRQPTAAEQRFLAGAALHPFPMIALEKGSSSPAMRAMDLFCPIGRGQRGLIVSAPGVGKTTFLQQICKAVAQGHPEIEVYCLLIDERPEEVTDFRRNANGKVYASSLDEPAEAHLAIVNDLMPRAFAAAAAGKDVLILLDSLSRLTRAFQAQLSGKGRTLSGGLSAGALEVPRQVFGAARKVEGQGSITMLATVVVDTGSLMEQVIFEEFKGTGNMELVLARNLAEQRLFPAIDLLQSSTRRSEAYFSAEDQAAREALLQSLTRPLTEPGAALRRLLKLFDKYPSNQRLLESFK